MFRFVVCVALMVCLPLVGSSGQSDEKKAARIKELLAEIASLKAKLTNLESELAKLEGTPYIGPVKKENGETFYSFKQGDRGHVGNHVYKVRRILRADKKGDGFEDGREDFAIFSLGFEFEFLAIGTSMRELSDGAPVTFKGEWRVDQPTLIDGKRYPTIRSYNNTSIVPK